MHVMHQDTLESSISLQIHLPYLSTPLHCLKPDALKDILLNLKILFSRKEYLMKTVTEIKLVKKMRTPMVIIIMSHRQVLAPPAY